MSAGRFDSSGRCTLCTGGWKCRQCVTDDLRDDEKRAKVLRDAAKNIREQDAWRIVGRFELESEATVTALEKGRRYLDTGFLAARY